jgi:anti-sigma-K factor RskA
MNDEQRDLAILYALDALPADERTAFEVALASDPDLRSEVEAHRGTTDRFDEVVDVAPPADLRASLLDEIAQTEQISTPAPVIDLTAARERRRSRVLLSAAAAVMAALIGVGVFLQTSGEPDVFASVAEQEDAQEAALAGTPAGSVDVAWSPTDGTFALRADGLPDPGDGRAYALWFIGSGEPEPVGLFIPEDGIATVNGELSGEPAVWAITIEPDTGSPAPTGEILYVAEV